MRRMWKVVITLITLIIVLLLSACTTVPVEEPAASASQEPSNAALMDRQFRQARALFMQQQYAQAAQLLLPLAQQGHLDAQYTIGYLYHYGQGVPRNEKEANRWITTAAARGHVKAQEALQQLDEYYGRPSRTP